MSIRAFFALPLKSQVVRRLSDHADSLCRLDPRADVLWVDSDSFHLTLCFLGEIELELVNTLEELTADALSGLRPFQLSLQQFEHYQVNRQLAVIAAIADLSDALAEVRERLVPLIEDIGIDEHQQDFKPHVTVGRMQATEAFTASEEWPALDELAIADSVVLYQSKNGANGSIYTPLFEVPLSTGRKQDECKF